MIKRIWEKQKRMDLEIGLFLLILFGMALYYGWRVFALTPWYDELYTYYYFISRGSVYAAIHWPLPNNHVGYSVLSALLDLFGNPAIGLRGISWISSLGSLCLLFMIGRKIFPEGFALVPVFIFSSMDMVNTLAVQGRGYALATCLYLIAVYELIQIIMFDEGRIMNYAIIAFSFIWALYTLPSSVYFVIPLCLIGGGWLLIQRRMREFIKLFVTALISALCTVGLYTIIWLAIGSNLLSKASDSGYYGSGHVSIILHAPFKAIQTGIQYMLDTPYIQSVAREGYLPRFGSWIKALLENYYPGMSVPLMIIICIGIMLTACNLVKKITIIRNDVESKQLPDDKAVLDNSGIKSNAEIESNVEIKGNAEIKSNVEIKGNAEIKSNAEINGTSYDAGKAGFTEWYMLLSLLVTPLMLIIQSALPYYRVFSFFAVPLAILITWLCVKLVSLNKRKYLAYLVPIFAGWFFLGLLFLPSYRWQYSDREAAIEDAYSNISLAAGDMLCVTDCDQEYLVKYLFDTENITYIPQEADYILIDKKLLLPESTFLAIDSYADAWKLYITYDEIPREYLEDRTEICYENDRFVMYSKIKQEK